MDSFFKTKTMKTRLFAALCLLCIALPLTAQWSKQGLHPLSIYEIKHRADTLYACTNDGIYVRHAFQPNDPWQAIGLQGKSISNLFFGTGNRMLAHELIQNPLQSAIHIADQNEFEVLVVQDAEYNRAPYFRMLATENTFDTIFNLSANRKTYDGGNTWHEMFDFMSMFRFIQIDPYIPEKMWIGGESMIFSPILLFSEDQGNSFESLPLYGSFFSGDNCTHWLIRNENIWFVPGEGVIAKSEDQGQSWKQVLNTWEDPEKALYFIDIAFSPLDSTIIYTSGGSFSDIANKRLNIIYSMDMGDSWQHVWHSFEDNTSYPVMSMLVLPHEGSDMIFLGADNGIYAYEHTITHAPDMHVSPFSFSVFPNPAGETIYVEANKTTGKELQFAITDMHGRTVLQQAFAAQQSKEYPVAIDINMLDPGIYLCTLQSTEATATKKLIVME